MQCVANTPVTLYRDYTELARRCEISQSAVGSPKNSENRCILFSIFTPWRSHGVPTAIVAFLRRFHGVLSRSCGVLVGDRLRAHGVLMACPRRAHRVLGAVTARARRAHGARTASTPFMPFRISIRIMLCLPAIVHVMSHSHQHSYHAVLPGNWTGCGVEIQLQVLPLFLCRSAVSIGTYYAFVSEWGAQRLHHSGPAGHANRQGMARLDGVQQPWWGRQSLNTQWGWQWRGCFIPFCWVCSQRNGKRRWTQWERRESAMVAVAAPCSFCESAMETIILNANAVQAP